ncbi:TPA: GIY-YIG nuclease family protein [Vibrio parahaemolyticus]|nr:GIY-YIG nuclease family protein [Vibrio parahaemolyticus]
MSKLVTFYEIAEQAGCGIDTVRRHARKLELETIKSTTPTSAGALVNCLSKDNADSLISALDQRGSSSPTSAVSSTVQRFGYFYLLQLVPEALPNRFKIGYTDNLEQRLNEHRTSAPTSKLIKSWNCKRSWDYAAMDSITREGCELVLNEVFEGDLEGFITRGDVFFQNMPSPETEIQLSKHSPVREKART